MAGYGYQGDAMHVDFTEMKEDSRSPIDEVCKEQSELVQQITDAIDKLENCLTPVLGQEITKPSLGQAEEGETAQSDVNIHSTLYNDIDHVNDRLRVILSKVRRIAYQVEL